MTCRDWMIPHPKACLAKDTAAHAARIMKEQDLDPVPVVQDRNESRLLGIVTERDLARKVVAEGRDPKAVRVEEIMLHHPLTCQPEDDQEKILSIMDRLRIRRVPVVDRAGHLIGVVSRDRIAAGRANGSFRIGASNTALLGGFCLGLGAALMFVFDPARGRRRRALIRDQAVHLSRQSGVALGKMARDLKNRAQGTVATAGAIFRTPDVSDAQLEARVRSRLGRTISHPHAVHVSVMNGRIILDGPVLEQEADQLLKTVASIEGVREVDNRLTLHATGENVPGLEGGRTPKNEQWEFAQVRMTPAARVLASAAGGSLLLLALAKGRR